MEAERAGRRGAGSPLRGTRRAAGCTPLITPGCALQERKRGLGNACVCGSSCLPHLCAAGRPCRPSSSIRAATSSQRPHLPRPAPAPPADVARLCAGASDQSTLMDSGVLGCLAANSSSLAVPCKAEMATLVRLHLNK